jgi:hypothetical protein
LLDLETEPAADTGMSPLEAFKEHVSSAPNGEQSLLFPVPGREQSCSIHAPIQTRGTTYPVMHKNLLERSKRTTGAPVFFAVPVSPSRFAIVKHKTKQSPYKQAVLELASVVNLGTRKPALLCLT